MGLAEFSQTDKVHMYTQDDDILTVLKSIFPDAHNISGLAVKLSSRVKVTGADLRYADFTGHISDDSALGDIRSFVSKSLSMTFECSYGKILIICKDSDELHFHPLELLEVKVDLLPFIMNMKKTYNASVAYPIVVKEKISPYAIKRSVV